MQLPPLEAGKIHVWSTTLAASADALAQHRALLADDEKALADRFLRSIVRDRYIVGRGILRRLLASYASSNPQALTFGYAVRGKPYLLNHPPLCFNLSHAGNAALIAVTWDADVGIDIEATTREVDVLGVARKVFSPDENARLTALGAEERRAAFFRIWTRKEAYIKAHGDGFGYATRTFSVSHSPGDEHALLADELQANAPHDWRVTDVVAPEGFCAALGAPGRHWSVLRFAVPKMLVFNS